MKLDDYKQNFRPHDVPPTLAKLVAFDATQDGYWSDGFELTVDDKGGIRTWSDNAEFSNALFPIGQANGSGSFYALWLGKGSTDLEAAPVVVFGDEGGVHVVAEDVKSLLRILTFDSEPMIDHRTVTFYKNEDDHEPSGGAKDYVAWLATELDLEPVKNAEDLVAAAQEKHAESFATWMKQYYDA